MLWYFVSYFRAQRVRTFLTVSGLSLALAAVFIAYGVTGWVDATSSKALSFVIDRASLWVVSAEGIHLDRKLDAIISAGKLSHGVADSIRNTDPTAVLQQVAVGVVRMNGTIVVLYATDDSNGTSLLASPEIWRSLGSGSSSVVVEGRSAIIAGSDPRLPARAIKGSFAAWASVIHPGSESSWLLIRTERPRLVANAIAQTLHARITDSPDAMTSEPDRRELTVFLLNASLSRFDPFSFRTKFSSLVVNAVMSTIFGWAARCIFLVGLLLAITSSLIGVREKRHEIGLFAALGLQSGVTLLLLFEVAVISAFAVVLGSIIGMVALACTLPKGLWLTVAGPSFVMVSIYATLLLILTPLIAAQEVASRRTAELVREGMAS